MNDTNTTTRSYTYTTGSNALEQFYSFFINPLIAVRFYQIGYTFTFLLGSIGNIASLLTFSRPTLRKISTGCLFIVLAVSDILYLLMCFFDYLEIGLSVPFYRRIAYDDLCRFRSFVMYVSQVASAWILVIVSMDRCIRTRFPFKSVSICTPKNALIAVAVLLVIDIGLHGHVLTGMFGTLIPGYVNGNCGPSLYSTEYLVFFYLTWSTLQIFVTCLVPVFFMLIILVDIFIIVRLRKRAVVQPNQDGHENRQANAQKQMFILMFASICIFFISSMPIALAKILLPRGYVIAQASIRTTIYTGLGWFQSLNYAINLYVHCLSSTLFRNEFKQRMKFLVGKNPAPQQTSIGMPRTGHRTQIHPVSIKL